MQQGKQSIRKSTSNKVSRQSNNSYAVTSSKKKVTNMNNTQKSNPSNQRIVLTMEQKRIVERNLTIGVYKRLHRLGYLTDYQVKTLMKNLCS